MYNPDYPTDQGYGFAQHTYQPAPRTEMFYWGGSNNFGPSYNDGSRRNMGAPMNPVNPATPNPFSQYGNQTATIPESAVQPYSSYPPSTPMNGGLNAMVESRRNMTPQQPTMNQNNPWAKTPQQPMPQQMPNPAVPQNPYYGWGNNGGYGYGSPDPNTMALYSNNNSFGFDKRNSWENYYTQNRPLPMPNIDWNAQQQNQNCAYPGCYIPNGYNPNAINQFPTAPINWSDKAKENWSL